MFSESPLRHNSHFLHGFTEYYKAASKEVAADLDNKMMVVDRSYHIQTKYRRCNRSDNKKARVREAGPEGCTELKHSYNVNFLFQ